MENITIKINGIEVSAPKGSTILEAARLAHIEIPTLCFLKDINEIGACRICVVEVKGARSLVVSCVYPINEGMEVWTNTPKVLESRRKTLQLLLSNHDRKCLSCVRSGNCELQQLCKELGVTDEGYYDGERTPSMIDDSAVHMIRDNSKCILCRRCVTVCNEIQHVGAIQAQNRGFDTVISPAMGLPLNSTACAMCGQCTVVCPTGALQETDGLSRVWKALGDPGKRVVVQVAPAVRAALGEEFGLPCGTPVTGKMASALHELGFDDVFDTLFSADLTIIEEGTELLHRLFAVLTGGDAVLPMITSCSPGWIKHIEHQFPEELDHLSTCKSPHTMMGAVVKSFYADRLSMDPRDLYVVSVMPCTAKKYEIERGEMEVDGNRDVDAVLTTRELARMIKSAGIDFVNLPEGSFDAPLGLSTGAADIFGVTGGVMEAALRTVYELVTGRELPFEGLHVTPIVGLEQIKTASFVIEDTLPEYKHLEGVEVKVAVTSGLEGASMLMREVADGTSPYHFIEVMGCPGGCIAGGGQPRPKEDDFRKKRAAALYSEDEHKPLRKSHENPDLMKLYEEFLGEPGGHLAHKLLHTHYVKRGKYNELV